MPLLGEMIAAALAGGGELAELTLNASNVVVPVDDDADPNERIDSPPSGDFVAITVSGATDLGPDDRWHPGRRSNAKLLEALADRLASAGARYAYVRRMPPKGSMTVFLPRAY